MLKEKHFGPVWFIPGENKGKYPFCHSLYVEEAGVLIDPSSDRERLVQLKKESGVNEIWLSHWHEDHLMHLDLFEDVPLCIMKPDAHPLSSVENFMDAYGVDDAYKEDWRKVFIDSFHIKPRRPDRFLKDGEMIDLGSTGVKVISAPGHTPGHMALLFENPGLLFMADYDLSAFGPWYGDVESSIDDTIQSVEKLRELQADVWITSHETGVFETEPGELWDRYLNVIKEREKKLLDLLETPKTLSEIVGACIIYRKPREPKYFFEYGEKAHMKKHLKKLIKENKVLFDGSKYGMKA